ncbi:hypothetical protein [Desulforamulus reducens]|nr:hypothetical protein [Desulforamulus reducens]
MNNRKKPRDKEPKLFSLFVTERMEDYAVLSLAFLILIIVLMVHQ